MNVVFAGTPVFAAKALERLIASEHSVSMVMTQPDRPAGRGKKLRASPVKQLALTHGLPIEQPSSLKDPGSWLGLKAINPDVLIVAAYGLILPAALLSIPRLGGVNIHASLLPRWRGAAPIQRAIEAGDNTTGVCIMQMEAGLDTGPVWLRRPCAIGPLDTGGQVHDLLAEIGAQALLDALALIEPSMQSAEIQSTDGVTYADKIRSSDRQLDFNWSAARLHNRVRAFDPTPGTSVQLPGKQHGTLKIWRSVVAPLAAGESAEPGLILAASSDQVLVQCGHLSCLSLLELQVPGGQRLSVSQFQKGAARLVAGERFILPGID